MIPKYTINLLSSLARWLDAKSETIWARSFGHSTTMKDYAKSLNEIVDYFKAEYPQCKRCGGTDGPLLRAPDPALDCHCVPRHVVIDVKDGSTHELTLTHEVTNVTIKFSEAGQLLSLLVNTGPHFKALEFDWLAPATVPLTPNTLNMLTFVSVSYSVNSVGYLLNSVVYDLK